MDRLCEMLKDAGYGVTATRVLGFGKAQIIGSRGQLSYVIVFKRDHLMDTSVSDAPGWRKRLEKLTELCTEYMGGEPLCRYDARIMSSTELLHYVHWNVVDGQEDTLVYDLVNRTGGFANAEVTNIELLDGRSLEDLIDHKLEAARQKELEWRKKYAGISGKDPGFCDMGRIEKAGGLGLFLEINMVESRRAEFTKVGANTMMIDADSPEKIADFAQTSVDYVNAKCNMALDYIYCQICERYDIAHSGGTRVSRFAILDGAKFMCWYSFYYDYLRENYPDEKMEPLLERYFSGEDISDAEPPGDWHAYQSKA